MKSSKNAGKPKTGKNSDALKKMREQNAKKSTALAKVADAPLTKPFIEKAKMLDEKVDEQISIGNRALTVIGRLMQEMCAGGYYRGLGFKTQNDYIDSKATARGMKHSQMNQAMRIYRELSTGPAKIPNAAINGMPKQNAEALSKMKPEDRTPKVIEAAQTLTEKRFQTEFALPALKKAGKLKVEPKGQVIPAERAVEIMRIGPWHLSKEVGTNFLEALDIMMYQARDDQRDIPLPEKALDAMAAEIKATYGTEYEQYRKGEEAKGEAAAKKSGE